MNAAPLIVSLQLDAATFAELDRLRRLHFPPQRNHLTAHLTLFHHLPGASESEIVQQLAAASRRESPMAMTLPSPRFLGRGVAVNVDCPRLVELRNTLADWWQPWLTRRTVKNFHRT